MVDASTKRYEARARIIRAMANPTRLMLDDELPRVRTPLVRRFLDFAECCLGQAAEEQ